ncbi:MAG TPA: lycopene cyclase domain-containing protein [Sporichthyaceae bacterium]
MSYTVAAVLAVLVALVVDRWGVRTRLIGRAEFWIAYGIVLFFQLLTNGWLTGRHIVRYDADVVLGGSRAVFLGSGRVAYAPVEDLLFGFALVLWTWTWWDWFGRRDADGQARRARR